MKLQFKLAADKDTQAIVALVNQAYRPTDHRKGWTHESDLIAGERTNLAQVKNLFRESSYLILALENDALVACVHVEIESDCANIGMLATHPERQGLGYGKRILAYAESFARNNFPIKMFRMQVLLKRKELLDFYIRRGYSEVGTTADYPIEAGVGSPIVAHLKVGMLIKAAVMRL